MNLDLFKNRFPREYNLCCRLAEDNGLLSEVKETLRFFILRQNITEAILAQREVEDALWEWDIPYRGIFNAD